jgi:hypothetical protein
MKWDGRHGLELSGSGEGWEQVLFNEVMNLQVPYNAGNSRVAENLLLHRKACAPWS